MVAVSFVTGLWTKIKLTIRRIAIKGIYGTSIKCFAYFHNKHGTCCYSSISTSTNAAQCRAMVGLDEKMSLGYTLSICDQHMLFPPLIMPMMAVLWPPFNLEADHNYKLSCQSY